MSIKPIGNRILLELLKSEEKTVSGIILPNTITSKSSNVGVVVAIGKIKEDINVGDRVFIKTDSGIEISDFDDNYLILDVEDVLAILK